jgi:uncharacterized protein (TIGR00251 family)
VTVALAPEPTSLLAVRQVQGACRFEVRAKARASRSAVLGVRDGSAVVAVKAPPVEGAANEELCAFIAKALAVPKRDVHLVTGERSKNKVVEVRGVTPLDVSRGLGLEVSA